MPSKGIHSVKGGHRRKRSVGAYGSTRGKERQKKKREDKVQNSRRVRESLAEARAAEAALEARIAAEAVQPPKGPVEGALYSKRKREEEEQAKRLASVGVPAQREVPKYTEARIVQPDPYRPKVIEKTKVLGETRSLVVNPLVWGHVLENGIDPKRVQVISEDEIIVHNKAGCWR